MSAAFFNAEQAGGGSEVRCLVKHVNGFNLCNNKDLTATQQIKCVGQDFLLKFLHRNFEKANDRERIYRKFLGSVVCGG